MKASSVGRTDGQGQERPVYHVRSVASRSSVVRRSPPPVDAAHRLPGQARRAVSARLCAIRRLRPLAHVVLYRPLRTEPRRDLEPGPAVDPRTHHRRLSAAGRPACGAGRQDPCAARHRGAGALWHRGWLGAGRPDAHRRVRGARPLRRPFAARRREWLPGLPARPWLCRRRPLERVRHRRRRSRWREALGLEHAQRAAAGAREGGTLRDRLYDRPGDPFRRTPGQGALVPPSQLRQAALALHGAGALPRPVRPAALPAAQSRRVGAGRPAPRARGLSPARGVGLVPAAGRRRDRAAGLYGPDQADRRPPGPPVSP